MLDDKKSLPLNFSDQLDGPFLLQETDAYKAQAIGRMVGVDLLDETMRDTLRDKKQIAIRREMLEADLQETEDSLKSFSDLDEEIAVREKVSDILLPYRTFGKRWNWQRRIGKNASPSEKIGGRRKTS